MKEYDDLPNVLTALETVQGNEKDERDESRSCQNFVTKKGGQWEEKVWQTWGAAARPRYTYDRTTPIIDSIVGELEQNEFAAVVNPASGAASKENAETLDSMVRSIQQWSDAQFLYKRVARQMCITGFDCVRVKNDYLHDDSFNQDLMIEYIHNSIDRVWFDPNSEEQDRSDAEWCVVLQAVTKKVYDEKWPEGSGKSVDTNRRYDFYRDGKREVIVVGEILYKKRSKKTLVQLSNGAVYDKKKSAPIIDELAAFGVQVVNERVTDDITVYSRKFDGADWLNEEQKTPFSLIPIVPFYHCFQVVEDKLTWRRIIEKLKDPQRILNYSISRQIEEGALAPRAKFWMTTGQAEGHEKQLKTLNTNADPVQFYNPDDKAPPPYQTGGAQINPALAQTSADAAQNIEAVAGMYGASLAKNPGIQSGVAIEKQIDKGNTGNSSFYVDMAKGITYLCQVLLDAIPVVYDTARPFMISNPDGTTEIIKLHDMIRDEDSGEMVAVNDLAGSYSVTASMGAMFRNRAEQANAALLEIGKVAPQAFNENLDIFVRNIPAPGMDAAADRIRSQLFQAGVIPYDQMTEEEQAEVDAAEEQPQQPDAMMVAAQAEMVKAEADMLEQRNKQAELQLKTVEMQIKAKEVEIKGIDAATKARNLNADTAKKVAETDRTAAETVGVALDNAAKQEELAENEIDRRIQSLSTDELIQIAGMQYGF